MTKRFMTVLFLALVMALAIAPVAAQDVQEVTFMTTFGGTELDALRTCTDMFTEQTGIFVSIESNRQLVPILRTRIAGGSPPDTALIPQPGTVAEFARAGALVPLVNADGSEGLTTMDFVSGNYGQSYIDLGTVDGALYGLLAKANSKSTIWYKPEQFEALGLEVPETWEELLAAQQTMIDAGITPWSIGGGSGWPLTDWFENIYVRVAGVENYTNLFLNHSIPWTDPTVVEAFERFGEIVHPADVNLAGGADGTLATEFIEAANMVFDPAQGENLGMYYEGGFIGGILAGNFPDQEPVTDFNAFLFPAINEENGAPVVGGGDLLVAFSDRPEVRQFIEWMGSPECNTAWAETGAVVSPNANVPLDVYSPLGAIDAGQVANASAFVFDGSDLMPGPVADAFTQALQGFIADPDSLQDQLQMIEDAAITAYPS